MDEVFGQKITDTDIWMEIEKLIALGSLDEDTTAFFQTLDQLHGLCQHSVDDYTKIQ